MLLLYNVFLRTYTIWETSDSLIYNYPVILWLCIKFFWEPFSLKRSHWWMWLKKWILTKPKSEIPTILLGADAQAKNRKGFWRNLWFTNFGWNKTAILELDDDRDKEYQLGYIQETDEGDDIRFCTLILTGKTAVLLGNQPVQFFARLLNGEYALLNLVEFGKSKWNISKRYAITLI